MRSITEFVCNQLRPLLLWQLVRDRCRKKTFRQFNIDIEFTDVLRINKNRRIEQDGRMNAREGGKEAIKEERKEERKLSSKEKPSCL